MEHRYNIIMKRAAIILLTLLFTSITASADSWRYVRVADASCGCKNYTKRVVVGWDSCKRPIYRYYYVPTKHFCKRYKKPYNSSYNRYQQHSHNYSYHSPYRGVRYRDSYSYRSYRRHYSYGFFCR